MLQSELTQEDDDTDHRCELKELRPMKHYTASQILIRNPSVVIHITLLDSCRCTLLDANYPQALQSLNQLIVAAPESWHRMSRQVCNLVNSRHIIDHLSPY